MHQTKKGNQWHFGMKANIGVDARTGLTHSFTTTAPESAPEPESDDQQLRGLDELVDLDDIEQLLEPAETDLDEFDHEPGGPSFG